MFEKNLLQGEKTPDKQGGKTTTSWTPGWEVQARKGTKSCNRWSPLGKAHKENEHVLLPDAAGRWWKRSAPKAGSPATAKRIQEARDRAGSWSKCHGHGTGWCPTRPLPLSRRRSGSNLVDILGDPVHLFRARHDGAGGSRKHHRLVGTQDSTDSAGERRPPPQLRSADVAGEATGRGATLYMASQGRAHPPAAASASTRPQLRLPRVALPWRLPQGAPPGKDRQAGGEAESEWRLELGGGRGGWGVGGVSHPLPFAAHSPVIPAALRHLLARRLTPRTPRTNKQTRKSLLPAHEQESEKVCGTIPSSRWRPHVTEGERGLRSSCLMSTRTTSAECSR